MKRSALLWHLQHHMQEDEHCTSISVYQMGLINVGWSLTYQQLQIHRWNYSNGRKRRGTREPLVEDERGEWKADLKVSIQKTKIMASGAITSWQIEVKKVEAVTNFIFLGSKITADGGCSHEIKRCLLLGRKVMTNLGIWNEHNFVNQLYHNIK